MGVLKILSTSSLVSVIIPTHRRPEYLKRTIESILNQTYSSFEVIVVSNGAYPANEQVVRSFDDARLVYADQENSGGPASPRNHGIRLAKGEYVAFCDDDDVWLPDKLEKQIAALKDNPGCGLCYTNMSRFTEQEEWTTPSEKGSVTYERLLYVNPVPISAVVIEHQLLKAHGGFCGSKSVGISEDYEFLLRYSTYTNFILVDEYLLKYWAGKDRTTATDDQRRVIDCFSYLMGVYGCFWNLYSKTQVSFFTFFKPLVFHTYLTFKAVLYIIYKNSLKRKF